LTTLPRRMKIIAANDRKRCAMKPKLEYASKGPYVQEAQMKLNALVPQQPLLLVDGVYSSKTTARVKQFQASRALVADGIVGAKTWNALDTAAPAATSGAPSGQPPKPSPSQPPKAAVNGVRVYAGAMLFCPFGTAPTMLQINEPGRTVAVTRDAVPNMNILPFGMCKSPGNPAMIAATEAAMGTLTPMPCTPAIAGPWSPPGMPLESAGTPPSPMIGTNSTLQCQFLGVIKIIHPGG
jgi:peptidoglycan hydrolase-like protein with peptidoglycan-binding domain